MKKMLAVFCIALLILTLIPLSASADDTAAAADLSLGDIVLMSDNGKTTLSYTDENGEAELTLSERQAVSVTQSGDGQTKNRIVVKSGVSANLTLCDLLVFADEPAVEIEAGAAAVLTLSGSSSLNGGKGYPAVHAGEGALLTITGSGRLWATAGADAAAIGGKNGEAGGTISIVSTTVDAFGTDGGAGIGGGRNGAGGDITIKNSTVLSENNRKSYIGNHLGDAQNPAEGGTGIGGGAAGAGNNVTIENSTVTVYGGNKAAGIGGGFWQSNEGVISIKNSTVTAYGGNTAAGIGGGRGNTDTKGSGGVINLQNSTVTATGGLQGAGIGSGFNNRSVNTVTGGSITISGGVTNAFGGGSTKPTKYDGAAGIGGGYKGLPGAIVIKDAAVVTSTGSLGASGIGSGADGSSFQATGGSISIAGGCDVRAYADGTKWAVDLNADVSGVSTPMLQGRFLEGALLLGSEVSLSVVKDQATAPASAVLPDGYRAFACNVPENNDYFVMADDTEAYPIVFASYLEAAGDTDFFVRHRAENTTLCSYDWLDFRPSEEEIVIPSGKDDPESGEEDKDDDNDNDNDNGGAVEIPDDDVPMGDKPAATPDNGIAPDTEPSDTVKVPNDKAPQAGKPAQNTPGGTVTIIDDDVPLAGSPVDTGDSAQAEALLFILLGAGALFTAISLSLKKKKA